MLGFTKLVPLSWPWDLPCSDLSYVAHLEIPKTLRAESSFQTPKR